MDVAEIIKQEAEEEQSELESRIGEINEFISFCRYKDIFLDHNDFEYSYRTGLLAVHKDIVKKLNPELFFDKDNLIDFNLIRQKSDFSLSHSGYLFGNDFTLLASPLYRRHYHEKSNWDLSFLGRFWSYQNSQSSCYLALDVDRIRLPTDKSIYGEKDYWYGPKFNKNIATLKDDVTKFVVPNYLSSLQKNFIFHNNHAIEIKWDTKGDIKTFQLMAFQDESIKVDGKGYPAKYLHAEFSISQKKFTHFDGAIQFFDEQSYYHVRDDYFRHEKKAKGQVKGKYIKLFKINDSLDAEVWEEMVGLYCSNNPLIQEYFTGDFSNHVHELIAKTTKG